MRASRVIFLLACLSTSASVAFAQARTPADGVAQLLQGVENALESRDEAALRSLIDASVPAQQAAAFTADMVQPDIQRVMVRERDRVPLENSMPGDGFRLAIEVFTETAGRARIITSLLDVRRPGGSDAASWRIVAAPGLTTVEGLFRRRVNPAPLAARNLTITAEDLRLTLHDGSVFLVEGEMGVTGLVLLGRGEMSFVPGPATEKGQLRIFAGSETLVAGFDSAFVRLNPGEYEIRASTKDLTPAAATPRRLRRAQEVVAREGPKSVNLDLSALSPDPWYLVPQHGDFLAEVRTRKFGTLTYTRAATQVEDISLFDRENRRTISIYPSADRLAARGPTYNEDDLREYDVLDYNVEASVLPDRQFVDGRVRMRIRVRSEQLSSLTLRLAETLTVRDLAAVEYGRLLYLRVTNQNTVIVNFPTTLLRDSEFTLVITYSGRVQPQDVDSESLQVAPADQNPEEGPAQFALERSILWSNRSAWYPQNPISDYATALMRITVPGGFGVVATGDPRGTNDVTLRDILTLPADGKAFVFQASNPIRYLALVVSRFTRVGTVDVIRPVPGPSGHARVRVTVDANPRQQAVGRELLVDAEAIVRFYADLVGDAPYGSATVAVIENDLPGGHSPGYFAVLNNPLPSAHNTWRNDPASFLTFPEFFAAHELAHQWWGQAVGWRNYHEQWISEGFAQYFAALYARQSRGEKVFTDMLRQFRRWAVSESDEGPINLGYRLGHIKAEPRIFRALIYNKGAAVLHMLRRTVGDDVFFRALRRFYAEQRFRKAGTDDLRRAFEAESGRPLGRFFDRWIDGSEVPRLRYATRVAPGAVTARFEQLGEAIFDIPVTVTLVYADGRADDVIVQVDDRRVEQRIPSSGQVREVRVNRDFAAVAEFTRD